MFTKCPTCSTVYSLSPADLSTAGGFVRCGGCDTTFNALKDLSDAPPVLGEVTTVDPGVLPAAEADVDEPRAEAPDAVTQTVADDELDAPEQASQQLLFGSAANAPAESDDAESEPEPEPEPELEAQLDAGSDATAADSDFAADVKRASQAPTAQSDLPPIAVENDYTQSEADLEALLEAELAAAEDNDDTASGSDAADDKHAPLDSTHPALEVVEFVDDVDAFEHQVDALADDDEPAVEVAMVEPQLTDEDPAQEAVDGDDVDNADAPEEADADNDPGDTDESNSADQEPQTDDGEIEEFDVDLAAMKPATDLNFVILGDESIDDTPQTPSTVELDELFGDEVDRSDIEVEFSGAADDWLDEDEGVDEGTGTHVALATDSDDDDALTRHPHPAPFRDVIIDLETAAEDNARSAPTDAGDDEHVEIIYESEDAALFEAIEDDKPPMFDDAPLTDDDPRDRKDLMNYLRPGLKPWQKVGGTMLALALTALLAGQAIHHWRSELVLNEKYGERVTELYARFDRTIQPAVSYRDYSVARHAVAPRDDDEQILQVRATVANRGDGPRPLPHVRVTFYDRFGDESFVRTFPPGVYSTSTTADRIARGGRTEVAVDVVNIDADGITNYLVEACAPLGNDQVSCSASSTGRRDNR